MIDEIKYLEEPKLIFGDNQITEDPRDGLLLYGPYERWGNNLSYNSYRVSAGVIGTKEALENYKSFVQEIKRPIISTKYNKRGKIESNEIQRPSFPGFEAVFNIQWSNEPDIFIEVKEIEIEAIIKQNTNRQIRTNKVVDYYLEKMVTETSGNDTRVNIWFVLVSKRIYNTCRSQKGFGTTFSDKNLDFFKQTKLGQTSLFSEEEMYGEEISKYFDTSSDFHHLLKARANQEKLDAPIQIIVEPKLRFRDIEYNRPYPADMKASIAWGLSTTLYYKLGKKPWKLASIRAGVCYLGLVFKKFQSSGNDKNLVCSAAQLFMSDGDGTVFRGNNGLWISENSKEYHLDENEACNLLTLALTDYFNNNNNTYPEELFIHGRATFSDKEWSGFERAVNEQNANTILNGIVIKDKAPLKLFRNVDDEKANYGVLRGLYLPIDNKEAYLFTRGFVPRMNTSLSMEIPNPLHVKITRGNANIEVVLKDIMALTKLNYNACIYGDGKPVTLRFSDTIGSILTATDNYKEERRQFSFYI